MALIKCPECGKEVSDKSEKCIYCGYPLNLVDVFDETSTDSKSVEPGPYRVFAVIGFVSGILALCFSCFFYVGCIIAIAGIIFSFLGKKSSAKLKLAKKGIIMNFIGLFIGLSVSTLIIIFIFRSPNSSNENQPEETVDTYGCSDAWQDIKSFLVDNQYEYQLDDEISIAFKPLSSQSTSRELQIKYTYVNGNWKNTSYITLHKNSDQASSYLININDSCIDTTEKKVYFCYSGLGTFTGDIPKKYNSNHMDAYVTLNSYNATGTLTYTKESYEKMITARVSTMIGTFSSWTNNKWGFTACIFGFENF